MQEECSVQTGPAQEDALFCHQYYSVANELVFNSVTQSLSISSFKANPKLVSLGKSTYSNTPPVTSASEATSIWRFTSLCIIIINITICVHICVGTWH